MTDIVTAVYSLMGHPPEDKVDEEKIKEKVESIFNVSMRWKFLQRGYYGFKAIKRLTLIKRFFIKTEF